MSNTRKFSDFDSPDSGIPVGGAKEAGVLLTDTLEDLREKTNGIVEEVNNIDVAYKAADAVITTAYVAADTAITTAYEAADTTITTAYEAADNAIKNGSLNDNALALDKIVAIGDNELLGNVTGGGDVAAVEINISSENLTYSDDKIPTSKTVTNHVAMEQVLRVQADAYIREGHATQGLNDYSVDLTKLEKIQSNQLLGNVGAAEAAVAEIEIDVTAGGLIDSDDKIPTSANVLAGINTAMAAAATASTNIREGHATEGLDDNSVELDKIKKIQPKQLLGNVGAAEAAVAEVEIDVAFGGLIDSDDKIPTSKAVRDYVESSNATIIGGGLTDHSVNLIKIQKISDNMLLGNVGGGDLPVAEIEIDVTANGLQNSDDKIPSSKAVRDYVATADATVTSAFEAADTTITTAYEAADNAIKEGGLNVNKLALDKIVETTARRLLGNVQSNDTDVTEIPIATSSGYNTYWSNTYGIQGEDASTPGVNSIPTSIAVKTYVDDRDDAIKNGGLDVNALALDKIVEIDNYRLLGNVSGGGDVLPVQIDTTDGGPSLIDSNARIPTSGAVIDHVDNKVATTLASAKTYADAAVATYDDNSGRIHFIDVYAQTDGSGWPHSGNAGAGGYGVGGYTALRKGPTTANVAYVASLMTGVVKAGHFVLARYRQHARYGGGNGTAHHNIQLLVMFKVASVNASGLPALTHYNQGYDSTQPYV